jgi:hypothetical protein
MTDPIGASTTCDLCGEPLPEPGEETADDVCPAVASAADDEAAASRNSWRYPDGSVRYS